ncbi:hypothetical protein QUA82_09785 [Microcoleus sp. F8-D3]
MILIYPSEMDAEQLKEQFEEFYLKRPCKDGIDWKALEKELEAEALEVVTEWHKRKKEWEREEAVRAGRI